MINLPGYKIQAQIYASSRTLVYQGIREVDSQKVIIKLMRNSRPNLTQLLQFRHQYTILQHLNFSSAIKVYSLENYEQSFALIMEDFGGISLKEAINQWQLSHQLNQPEILKLFLEIAIQIAEILDQLNHHRVIHKDIKPANILVNPQTKEVKIIDFSIASQLPKESQTIINPSLLEGTLAYISPEQTGRMNRGIDSRSDLYSLGVSFYELLTDQLPFATADPMELIHCHIAKTPTPVHLINPKIPLIISQIIEKLMAKMAENRYQTALGLKHDLETCLKQLNSSQTLSPFELGKRDINYRFIIPEKLYGREAEIKILLETFERVIQGQPEVMLVAGFSGIGKTAIINDIHKPIVRQRGYFIKGKFDQFKRDIPLSAFVQAFQNLIEQLLTENESQIYQWKSKILSALGENAQALITLIPELELLIGSQPPSPEISETDAQNRLNLLFQKLIQVFTTSTHSLVIFLDDLQWADLASLNLIQVLVNTNQKQCLLLIGAYRDNEVFPTHPLTRMLSELQSSLTPINTLTLTPLTLTHLNQLVSDTLNCSLETALPLTQLVYQKTQGNPFFSHQFLKALYEENLINFNFKTQSWQCEITQIQALSLTDDIVEFMAIQLQKLSPATQEVLKLAACIGNSFDLHTLSLVCETLPSQIATNLWEAIQEGFIIPQNQVYQFFQDDSISQSPELGSISSELIRYKFLHDRVQQAAYLLIHETQKPRTHLQIGQLLLKKTDPEDLDHTIFEIVNQLNRGIHLIQNPVQQVQVAQLNLKAGQKALNATAYTAAVEYLMQGISLCSKISWKIEYELKFALYVAAAKAQHLTLNFEVANKLINQIQQQVKSRFHQIKIYELNIQFLIAQNQMPAAIEMGVQALEFIGISLTSKQPNVDQVEFLHLPTLEDPEKIAALQILTLLVDPAYGINPQVFEKIVLTMVNLCLEFGNCSLSAYTYAVYSWLLCGQLNQIEKGYQFIQLALSLPSIYNAKELQGKIYQLYNAFIRHWKEPANLILEGSIQAFERCLEAGNIDYACFAIMHYCAALILTGEPIDFWIDKQGIYLETVAQFKRELQLHYGQIWRQLSLNFCGKVKDSLYLAGEAFDEVNMLPILEKNQSNFLLFAVYVAKLILCYFWQDYEQAKVNVTLAQKYENTAGGSMTFSHFVFYSLLTKVADQAEGVKEVETQFQSLEKNLNLLKKWAELAPTNYQHKYDLIQAELARVQGNTLQAMELYDQAIAGAKLSEYRHEEALANERAAQFYLEIGKEKIAKTYMIDAYYAYARWGALGKLHHLETNYSHFLAPILQQEKLRLTTRDTLSILTQNQTVSSTNVAEILELSTVIKAYQALSEEINLSKLVSTLMRVVIENAGASKAVLILKDNNEWQVTALKSNIEAVDEGTKQTQPTPLEHSQEIPLTVINYVKHTQKILVIDDIFSQPSFASDLYIINYQPKSILSLPISYRGQLIGILYLENTLIIGAFNSERIELLQILSSQAAIALENARLYEKSQQNAQQLEESLQTLKKTQLQIIQSEKMAAIGQLMAGIAHEINNPVGFISGNLNYTFDYVQDLISHLTLYQKNYPNPVQEIQVNAEEIDLDFLLEDLPNLIESMKQGTQRVRDISKSMRIFARSDQNEAILFDVHEGINSTLLILQHRLKANSTRPAIKITKNYANLPKIFCYPGQLNQVLMNLLTNAIDAIDAILPGKTFAEVEQHSPEITIQTQIDPSQKFMILKISDNGTGMTTEVQNKIFDHLFTTKPVGLGTGLGLSISREIIEQKHQGQLSCHSVLSQGTTFTITLPMQ